jgi:hypothetical protein
MLDADNDNKKPRQVTACGVMTGDRGLGWITDAM